jgi:hypothetical protein
MLGFCTIRLAFVATDSFVNFRPFVEKKVLDGLQLAKKTRRKGIIDIGHKQYSELHTYITKKYPPATRRRRKAKRCPASQPLRMAHG